MTFPGSPDSAVTGHLSPLEVLQTEKHEGAVGVHSGLFAGCEAFVAPMKGPF